MHISAQCMITNIQLAKLLHNNTAINKQISFPSENEHPTPEAYYLPPCCVGILIFTDAGQHFIFYYKFL